jgi:hypothetical protein
VPTNWARIFWLATSFKIRNQNTLICYRCQQSQPEYFDWFQNFEPQQFDLPHVSTISARTISPATDINNLNQYILPCYWCQKSKSNFLTCYRYQQYKPEHFELVLVSKIETRTLRPAAGVNSLSQHYFTRYRCQQSESEFLICYRCQLFWSELFYLLQVLTVWVRTLLPATGIRNRQSVTSICCTYQRKINWYHTGICIHTNNISTSQSTDVANERTMLICFSWCLYIQPSTQRQLIRNQPTAAWEIHVRVYFILTFSLIKFPSKLRGLSRPGFITDAYIYFAKSREIGFIVNKSFNNFISFTMYVSIGYNESSYRIIICILKFFWPCIIV